MKTLALAESATTPFRNGTLEEVKTLQYPLARPIYMVVDREPGSALAAKIEEFLTFVLSREGQDAIAASDGWLPLPANLAAAERRKLR
jgi:phosphate transport system substrate-binding protein